MMTLFSDNVPTFDALTVALLIACILYSVCFILAMRKLAALVRIRPEISTKMLLLLSVGLVSLVRTMTLLLVAAMNVANVRAHYSLQPTSNNQGFYDKAMTVLFDLPNCIVVSTYTLLTLVWAECFLESRFHTESVVKWKRRWLLLYIVFNSTLYTTQLILYTCIFFAHKNNVVRTVVYAAITGINFVSVFLVMLMYLYLNVRFSGFPFRNGQSRRALRRVSSVMTLWSATRIIWGVATLLVFIYNVELLQDSHTPVWSFVVLLLLFFVCEILPIIAMLDYSYAHMLGMEQRPDDLSFFATDSPIRPTDLLLSREPLLNDDDRLFGDAVQQIQWQDPPQEVFGENA